MLDEDYYDLDGDDFDWYINEPDEKKVWEAYLQDCKELDIEPTLSDFEIFKEEIEWSSDSDFPIN